MYPDNNLNNNIINSDNKNNYNNKANGVLKIVVWILIILLIITAGYYAYNTFKEEKENFTFDFDIGAVGFEFNEAFDIKKYEYNLNVDTREVQISCSTKYNVEGCNEVVTINGDSVDHIVKYAYDQDRIYTYTIHINRKETIDSIKVNSIKNNEGNIVIDAYSTLNNTLEYSFDNGASWQKSNTYKVYDNEIVSLIIRDNNGNKTKTIIIEVNDIDKIAPTFDIVVNEKTETKIVLRADAQDNYSGVDSYNWNNTGYTNKATYEVTTPGTYTLSVKDKVGNESVIKSINITKNDFSKKENSNNNVNISKKTYIVKLMANGSNINNTSLSCSTTGLSCKVKLPIISRTGGIVIGWSENSNEKTAQYKSGEEISITENKTLYAITAKKLIVTFDKNGATNIGSTSLGCTIYNNQNTCNITMPTIERKEGNIIGWSSNKNSTKEDFKTSSVVAIDSNKTLYAITSKKLIATFDKNGATSIGSTSQSCNVYNTGTSCNIKTPTITMTGGSVLGWSDNRTDKTAKYKVDANISINTNKTFYAITKKSVQTETKKIITVTFDKNGATNVGQTTLSCTSVNGNPCSITLPSITKSGWTILGWSENKGSTTAQYKVNDKINVSNNKTLYAITSNKLIATFDKNGATNIGSTSENCTIYNTGASCNIKTPTITMTGGNVLGWSESKTDTTAKYGTSTNISINTNKTFYAITKKDINKTITVTFDKNGATNVGQTTLSCTSVNGNPCSITLPSITKSGGTILGWSENKGSTTAQYKVNEKINISGNKTLYAITSKTITVTFETGGARDIEYTNKDCTMFNTQTSCSVRIPFNNRPGLLSFGYNVKNNMKECPDYVINKSYNFTDSVTLTPNYNENNKYYRNISVAWTKKYGKVQVEVDSSCYVSDEILSYFDVLYSSKLSFLFKNPSKLTVLYYVKFREIYGTGLAGSTVGNGDYDYFPATDINCFIYKQGVVHELAHKWDKEYMLKYGDFIAHQSDVMSLYNKYKAMDSKDRPLRSYSYSSEYEFFADMLYYYYDDYIIGDPNKNHSDYRDDIKQVIEKYIAKGI